jgi:S1-C subfamily serine protease
MTDNMNVLAQLSAALTARAEEARASVVAIRDAHTSVSGILWANDVVVTSAQSLSRQDVYSLTDASGQGREAKFAGVDTATNVAVLKLSASLQSRPLAGRIPAAGELALAFGTTHSGGPSTRLGIVNAVGDAWCSREGGQIDKRIGLDIRLDTSEEGGPVLDASGGFIGMSTFGPGRRVIAIPASTLERVVPVLLKDGHVARGWLGLALQPVAVPESFRGEDGQCSALMAMSVDSDGPAAKAGVLAGDILLSVDGQSTRKFRNIAAKLGSGSVGRQIELRLVRAGALQSLALTVEARPSQ